MKRLLITGASGNLGRPLSALAASLTDTTSTFYHHPAVGGGNAIKLDLRDISAVISRVGDIRPDVIIHTAVSERSDDMVETNHIAAQAISQAAQLVHARLIVLSSDLVFDGTNPPYNEESLPTPLSPYGQVKADNEHHFITTHDDCLVVRTSLIYDLDPSNNQAAWLHKTIEKHQQVPLFVDEIRQPIWVWNLADILLDLVDSPLTGILNVAGPQSLSRWEYGCALLDALGYKSSEIAQPVYAAQIAPQRPRDCTLDLTKAKSVLRVPMLSLDKALALAVDKSGPSNLHNHKTMI